jgi:hypothetical protein
MLNKNGLFKRLADEKKKVRGGGGGNIKWCKIATSTPHYGSLFLSGSNKAKQKWFSVIQYMFIIIFTNKILPKI